MIDEYQDCELHQHQIAMGLSSIVPTVVFGDPMQGIFEFVDTRIRWSEHIDNSFTTAYELTEPHRWTNANSELGRWISYARQQLMTGQPLDLRTGPLNFLQCNDAFEMGLFFNGFDQREGTTAAIHCRRGICNRLAQSTNGAYQTIEEIAAARLMEFAAGWDGAQTPDERANALRAILNDTMTQANANGEVSADHTASIAAAWQSLRQTGSPTHALEVISRERAHPLARTYRAELLNDAKRALKDLEAGRRVNLVVACEAVRHRLSHTGRAPTVRTISTPLLLKGLEYDHVLIPDATHFLNEMAAAKLFYVAISRARWSLTIASRNPVLQFPIPNL
ncbi:UvrD-helicase domain-containing protein [Pseudomonas bijieensis]